MNHLLKTIQFYKLLKESDTNAINTIIIKNKESPKQIKIQDFIFSYNSDVRIETECDYCLEKLYTLSHPLITLEINNTYYYLKQPTLIQLYSHFEITNLSHTKGLLDFNSFKIINDLFPSFLVIYHNSNHKHFDLGLIDLPILNKDATHKFNNVYLVDWYLQTYFIKEKDFEDLFDEYNNLLSKLKPNCKTLLFYKKGNKFHLYMIMHNELISPFEAAGLFNITDEKNSLALTFDKALSKIKSGRI